MQKNGVAKALEIIGFTFCTILILCGFVFAIEAESFWLFLAYLGGGIVELCLFLGFATIIQKLSEINERMELIRKKVCVIPMDIGTQKQAERYTEQSKVKTGVKPRDENEKNPMQETPVAPITIEENKIQCPACGELQNANRMVCWKCGQKFQTDTN